MRPFAISRVLPLGAMVVALLAPPAASAEGSGAPIATDSPSIAMEVGTAIQVGYEVQSTAAGCVASPAAPTLLAFSAPPGVGVGPTPLVLASCDAWVFATVSASAPVTGTIVVTASDALGHAYNAFAAVSSIFVHAHGDTTPPVVSVPPQYVAEATSPSGARVAIVATASDPDDTVVSTSCAPRLPVYPIGVTPLACSAKDSNGNVGVASTQVVVVDTTPPSFAAPGDVTLVPDGAPLVGFAVADATDVVDVTDPVLCSPASGSAFPAGTTTVSCTSTDAHGNAATRTFRVTIVDKVPPSATSTPLRVEATGPAGAQVLAYDGLLAFDFIDPAPTVTCLPAAGATFPLGSTTVACVAADRSGNSAAVSFPVSVVDTTPPTLALPAPAAEATGPSGAAVAFSAGASDLVDGTDPVLCSPASGSVFPVGQTLVSCASTDAHGNVARGAFLVTVRDSASPVLSLPPDATREATGPAGAAVAYDASASDAVDGALPVLCSSPSGATFPLGSTTVACSAVDSHGNVVSGSFRVAVVDTTPPALTLPANASLAAAGPRPVGYAASALDLVDGAVTPVCSPAPGSTFPIGRTLVACTATDAHGNAASGSFAVEMSQALPPRLALPPDLTLEAAGPAGAPATYPASATDPQDGPLAPSCAPASGATFPLGATTVVCSAMDSYGLSANGSFTVTVRDTTPPTLALPAPMAVSTGGASANVTFSAGASDLVDGADPVSCAPASGSSFLLGATTVSCSSHDAHGNAASAAFTVTVTRLAPECDATLFRPPIDTPGHDKDGINSFKAGSTVPVKLQVDCHGRAPPRAPTLFYGGLLPDGSVAWEKAARSTSGAVGDNAFRPAGIQWLFNWDTSGLAADAYRLRVDVGDGALHALPLQLTGAKARSS